MPKLTKRAIRYGRTNGPTINLESFAFKKERGVVDYSGLETPLGKRSIPPPLHL